MESNNGGPTRNTILIRLRNALENKHGVRLSYNELLLLLEQVPPLPPMHTTDNDTRNFILPKIAHSPIDSITY